MVLLQSQGVKMHLLKKIFGEKSDTSRTGAPISETELASTPVVDTNAFVEPDNGERDAPGMTETHRETPVEYWSRHNVTNHLSFPTTQASLDYLSYRNEQYLRFKELLPVRGFDGQTIVDLGCGPGHDLVWFHLESKPKKLIGVDVSGSSLQEASARLKLHGFEAELIHHDIHVGPLPIESGSADLVRANGVLQHFADPIAGLKEMRRLLRPGGVAQIMVYNYNSLWMHLYVAYVMKIQENKFPGMDKRAAFELSTDGPDCPHARCYELEEFRAIVEPLGFKMASHGCAVSSWEMKLLPLRFDALLNQDLDTESREFLASLRFDDRGLPLAGQHHAGVDGCYTFIAI
ncbi:class I SAM-dependent methyltransferase [Bradyrhizobium sp. JYMT SZCCT0428]|uniref:class I SAM-dependent methyltransferase n=1 Tax=Bradyrhizobium sp. JYMT SZCCT0428 TaxID=2807673 RepID=UPI001BA53987|nr:methyltransferase domain-containing protein [Bradyrhizobium sp. JYMT SZCCT0428]MBR1156130.1 methyltransferase domain-containing protein [Bradyrhizobium sp. JYMT SZCCT0428]